MGHLPVIKAARLIPILTHEGFIVVRQKGSHVHLEHHSNKTRKVTVPYHNKELPKKTLLSILKQAGITLDVFFQLLGKD